MSTRANIKFSDKWDTFYLDRSHDGFPDNILPDINEAIEGCRGRWSGSELGQLVTFFLGIHFDRKTRIQNYEPCSGPAGDVNHQYWVKWDSGKKEYEYGLDY